MFWEKFFSEQLFLKKDFVPHPLGFKTSIALLISTCVLGNSFNVEKLYPSNNVLLYSEIEFEFEKLGSPKNTAVWYLLLLLAVLSELTPSSELTYWIVFVSIRYLLSVSFKE